MIPATLANNPSLDRWVGFEPGGVVRIAFGKVEYGQGAVTALAQLAAEELDVAFNRLRVVNAATGEAPDEGLTVGSMSIETSGASVRQVCAEVRALVLAETARRIGCEPAELEIEDGAILRSGVPTGEDYWSLQIDLARPATGEPAPKPPGARKVVGHSQPRLDLPAKVFGAAFIQDIRLPGMIHARVLRQPGPLARLAALDQDAVRRAAGGELHILSDGAFVAFLSPSETVARRAVEAAELRAVWDGARALEPKLSESVSLKDLPSTLFESAAPPEPSNRRRHQAAYSRPYISHGSMGPSCGVAVFENGVLTLHTHAQGVYPMRQMAARVTGLPIEAISVHHAQGAGNYGHNGSDDAAIDAAVIAVRRPGTPIRVQWRREDEFGHAPVGTAMHIEMTGEVDASGRLVDFSSEIWSGPHVGRGRALAEFSLPHEDTPPPAPTPQQAAAMRAFSGGRLNAVPSYDIAVTRVSEHTIAPTPVRTSSLRGLGGPVNSYAGECFIDELAEAAGADPLAYRLSMLSDPRAVAVLQALGRLCDWPRRSSLAAGRGLGLGYDRHRDRGAYVAAACELEVDDEVRLKHLWCVADAGLIINPDGARNQIEGGMIMAASWALKEQVKLGGAGIVSTTWGDYPILRFDEIPLVTIELIDQPDQPPTGIGEISSGPALGAIGNAVAQALGARIRELPYTRERIAHSLLAT
jgi:nicotinate dehydrogenase subunit B